MSTIHHVRSRHFAGDAADALANVELRGALARAQDLVNGKRQRAVDRVDEWEAMREHAHAVKRYTLAHLDELLEDFERNALARGMHVHWADDAQAACDITLSIAEAAGAGTVAKAKSMLTEEIGLNPVLEAAGMTVVETDLGEWIVQLAGEPPSHIVAPAIHRSRLSIHKLFEEKLKRSIPSDAESMTAIARDVLRDVFMRAEVGISGVNYLVADTGSFLTLENEGNHRLATSLPRVHIALSGIEKLIPRLADLDIFLRMIGRSGTGQTVTTYQNLFAAPETTGGPDEIHIVLVNNGRSGVLADKVRRQTLNCIRCGACLNICPVYRQIGGHAYGSVYPGPIGSIFTPQVAGLHESSQLPYASSLCGACADVCPVKIDIPAVLLDLRVEVVASGGAKGDAKTREKVRAERPAFKFWSWCMRSPTRYRLAGVLLRMGARLAGRTTVFDSFVAPLKAWRSERSVPQPEGDSFRSRYARLEKERTP